MPPLTSPHLTSPTDLRRFISFEGGDGSGKTTLIRHLGERLSQQHSLLVQSTYEPGGSPLGHTMRSWLLTTQEKIGATAEFLLFSADRAEHTRKVILPALKEQRVVLCDRYADSSRVYQGLLRGLDHGFLEEVITASCEGITPSLTVLLDGDPQVFRKRLHTRAQHTQTAAASSPSSSASTSSSFTPKSPHAPTMSRFDALDEDFHRQIRDGFRQLAQQSPKRFYTVDAEQSIPDLLEVVYQKVCHHLQL